MQAYGYINGYPVVENQDWIDDISDMQYLVLNKGAFKRGNKSTLAMFQSQDDMEYMMNGDLIVTIGTEV